MISQENIIGYTKAGKPVLAISGGCSDTQACADANKILTKAIDNIVDGPFTGVVDTPEKQKTYRRMINSGEAKIEEEHAVITAQGLLNL